MPPAEPELTTTQAVVLGFCLALLLVATVWAVCYIRAEFKPHCLRNARRSRVAAAASARERRNLYKATRKNLNRRGTSDLMRQVEEQQLSDVSMQSDDAEANRFYSCVSTQHTSNREVDTSADATWSPVWPKLTDDNDSPDARILFLPFQSAVFRNTNYSF
jgi:hypothetical protein